MEEKQSPKRSTTSVDTLLLGLIFVVLLIFVLAISFYLRVGDDSPPAVNRPIGTRISDPYATFQTVRNDCGACGTSSPVGGWEAEDGRALVLNKDGSFITFFTDETTMSGEWEKSGSQLCLSPATGGETCFAYQQKVDAMKLDDAIYIRR